MTVATVLKQGVIMKISKLVAQLLEIKEKEGDIESTCTGTVLEDGPPDGLPDVFESTVENLVIGDHPRIGRRVRLFM